MLSSNMLSSNMLSSNMLSSNMLSSNQLSPTTFELNTSASLEMELTESGRMVLRYLVKCALNEDMELVFTVAGMEYRFSGLFGIVPEWTVGAIDTSKRYAMTACLLGHVNDFEVAVPISGRFDGVSDVTPEELDSFTQFEGAFYGNMFAMNPKLYACRGETAPDFTVSYPDHDTTRGDRLLRRCTDSTLEDPLVTECGFTYVGYCSDVCDAENGGSYSNCWSKTNSKGTMYADTMNIWLLAHDDSKSVWPELYPLVYSP